MTIILETTKNKKLFDIAQGVADITEELMEDSIDWQLEDFPQDGDEYGAIHAEVLQMTIKIMYKNITSRTYN